MRRVEDSGSEGVERGREGDAGFLALGPRDVVLVDIVGEF